MRCKTLIYIVINFSFTTLPCIALDISSKIDFDENSKSSETTNNYKLLSHGNHKNENERKGSEFENIGFISLCTENCNASHSKDSLQTNFELHIKGNIDLNNHNKSITEDGSSDIPIVVGSTPLRQEENSRTDPIRQSNRQYSYFQSTNAHPGDVFKNANYYPPIEHKVKVNFDPSVILEMEKRTDIHTTSKQNKIDLHPPHFESLYHRHYFGEHPPPQIVWYPKRTEYQLKSAMKPLYRTVDTFSSATSDFHGVAGVAGTGRTCTCKNDVPVGLQWYPTNPSYNTASSGQINDKLTPLD